MIFGMTTWTYTLMAVAILARYGFHLSGAWRWIYVIGAVIALYLNVLGGSCRRSRKCRR